MPMIRKVWSTINIWGSPRGQTGTTCCLSLYTCMWAFLRISYLRTTTVVALKMNHNSSQYLSGCYVLDNGYSYPRLSSNVDQVVWLFCPEILVLVFLPIWIDYFNGCVRARSFGIAAQIKIMRKPLLVFIALWFSIYHDLPSEKYKILSWKKKEFEDLKDLLISFRLYFVIVKDSSCISTMYFLLL
jgi:hypothetical protein